jgi:hypothetical protein
MVMSDWVVIKLLFSRYALAVLFLIKFVDNVTIEITAATNRQHWRKMFKSAVAIVSAGLRVCRL